MASISCLCERVNCAFMESMLSLVTLEWLVTQSIFSLQLGCCVRSSERGECEHALRDVEQGAELVLGSKHSLDLRQVEKSRWQTGQLVLRKIHLL